MGSKVVLSVGVVALLFLVVFSLYQPDSGQVISGAVATELPSSSDVLDVESLRVYEDRVIIQVPNATISKFANTNSMDPTLDEGAHGIEVDPVQGSLQVGDIVSYYSRTFNEVVIHRIVAVSEDENGTYYTLKGDNNEAPDRERVRFEQLEGILVGIIY